MLKFLALPIAALALPLALCACATQTASPTPPTGRDCFNSREISGYSVVDDNHVRVDAGPGRFYIFTTSWNTRELDWTQHIAVHSTSNWICTGNGLGIEITGGRPRQTYPITDISRGPPPAPQGS